MRELQRVELARLLVGSVAACQRDLCACFDLLVEFDQAAMVELEPRLFAAHRALGELSQAGRRLVAVEPPCWLLRGPSPPAGGTPFGGV